MKKKNYRELKESLRMMNSQAILLLKDLLEL